MHLMKYGHKRCIFTCVGCRAEVYLWKGVLLLFLAV